MRITFSNFFICHRGVSSTCGWCLRRSDALVSYMSRPTRFCNDNLCSTISSSTVIKQGNIVLNFIFLYSYKHIHLPFGPV